MTLMFLALFAVAPPSIDPPLEYTLARSRPDTGRSLRYELTFDESDQVPGNAAPMWIRAGLAARRVNYKWKETEWEQMALPLDKLPLKHFKEVLAKHASALALADQAARRTRCDWERPPVTIQSIGDEGAIPLDEIQTFRELANLLKLCSRIELAERDFDKAHQTLRTGITLARHIGESNLLIQDLVAIAIASIMLGQVQEWACTPGSPNLYWPLAALPRPLITVRHSIRYELNTIYRSFPALRDFKARKLGEAEATVVIDKVFTAFARLSDDGAPADWMRALALKMAVAGREATAKRAMLERGRTEKELAGMPAIQLVALYYLDDYDRTRDDIIRLIAMSPDKGVPQLMALEKKVRAKAKEDGNPLIALLMPAVVKVRYAEARLELIMVGLLAAEALRGGMNDPGLKDPFTGKPTVDWLRREKGRTVLYVPAPPLYQTRLGQVFILPDR